MMAANPQDSIVRSLRDDMLAKQDAWIQKRADDRGLTVDQLAEIYTLEYGPIQLVSEESDWRFRATQEIRLRKRDKHAPIHARQGGTDGIPRQPVHADLASSDVAADPERGDRRQRGTRMAEVSPGGGVVTPEERQHMIDTAPEGPGYIISLEDLPFADVKAIFAADGTFDLTPPA